MRSTQMDKVKVTNCVYDLVIIKVKDYSEGAYYMTVNTAHLKKSIQASPLGG